jgi:6-pyruvoyltetrahydropterin/6-carboxytetrahydropterin synthase
LEIDAGHRVYGHEGKCAHVHGHRYKFEIHATATELDIVGRVIDFSIIKEKIGQWLDDNWDHGMILWVSDPVSQEWISPVTYLYGHKYFLLPYNPTAENLADFLLDKANELLKRTEVRVFKVVCWETPNCWASAEV